MNAHKHLRRLLILGLAAGLAQSVAPAEGAAADSGTAVQRVFGSLHGVTLAPGGVPLAEVSVVIHCSNCSMERRLVTDSRGTFTVEALQPGSYEITASKEGFANSAPTTVDIAQNQIASAEVSLKPNPGSQAVVQRPDNAPLTEREKQLLDRIERLEGRLAAMEATQPKVVIPAAPTAPSMPASVNIAAVQQTANKTAERLEGAPIREPRATDLAPTVPLQSPAVPQPAPVEVAQNQAAPAAAAAAAALPQDIGDAPAVPATPVPVDMQTPFADADWTWLNGNSRQHDSPLDTKYFSGEFRADTFYGEDFNQPIDHSMGGSSEVFRSDEVQLEDLSLGGDFHAGHMRGRVLTLFGMFATTTPRNDASAAIGQWDVRSAYRYVSEAYGGYHFDVNHGLNIDAGIFVSYVGLFSYHNFDNWAYQPSYVSSNTPWFFNGVRIQWFPTNHLKIEPWFINGWQSYNKYNGHPGLGGQLKWTAKPWLNVILNQYGFGEDNVGLPRRTRYHTDDSVEVKYYDKPKTGYGIDRIAFTFTGDMGCETGQGVSCAGDHPYDAATGKGGPKQSFLGYMLYNRWWWHKDLLAFTLGGGQMNNPGRYLTLVLPVNGADAISGTPYFPAAPGLPLKAYDGTATLDWMPSQFTTFRLEFGFRHTNYPYWSGRGGITPPGGNNGSPQYYVCNSGATAGTASLAAAYTACGGPGSVWFPDLREGQALLSLSIMVKL
jgi:hypothetical protein